MEEHDPANDICYRVDKNDPIEGAAAILQILIFPHLSLEECKEELKRVIKDD